MNEMREIVTKAVVAKGKKIIRLKCNVTPNNEPFSILGCWIINHEFEANLRDNIVDLNGRFEINIWYAYENNTSTDIAKQAVDYSETVRTRQIVKEVSSCRDVIVRILQQPTCTNASIVDNSITVDIVLEVLVEIIGETKMMVTVFTNIDTYDVIDDNFENEINENFINESKIVG